MPLGSLFCLLQKLPEGGRVFSLEQLEKTRAEKERKRPWRGLQH